jgi:hypothetical protein
MKMCLIEEYHLGQRIAGLFFILVFTLPLWAAVHYLPAWTFWLLVAFAMLVLPVDQLKECFRAQDQLVNATFFGGYARESLSSHTFRAFREGGHWWPVFIMDFTDLVEEGHCREANRHEQPVVDFINTADL